MNVNIDQGILFWILEENAWKQELMLMGEKDKECAIGINVSLYKYNSKRGFLKQQNKEEEGASAMHKRLNDYVRWQQAFFYFCRLHPLAAKKKDLWRESIPSKSQMSWAPVSFSVF